MLIKEKNRVTLVKTLKAFLTFSAVLIFKNGAIYLYYIKMDFFGKRL